jgi:putative mycofactocin binding protein MftB
MTRYVLHPACRVREESFGLLFYDLRGPRLLFAETGDVVSAELLRSAGVGVADLCGRTEAVQRRVARLFESLVKKGFLREQSVR